MKDLRFSFLRRSRARLAVTVLLFPATTLALDAHHAHHGPDQGVEHSEHRQMMETRDYQRSSHNYQVPDAVLTDVNGNRHSLVQALGSEQPVVLNFIYTSCTTICPVMTSTVAQFQKLLGPEASHAKVISISIDPEHDTPNRLKAYADGFGASPAWLFLTGRHADIIAIQKAFDIYRGSKSNHVAATFLRRSVNRPWTRLEGLTTASDLFKEYQKLMGE